MDLPPRVTRKSILGNNLCHVGKIPSDPGTNLGGAAEAQKPEQQPQKQKPRLWEASRAKQSQAEGKHLMLETCEASRTSHRRGWAQ